MSPFATAMIYVLQTAFSLYLLVVMVRFLLQLVRADFYNPLSQFVVRATNPLLTPMRRLLPAHKRIDIPSLVLALLIQMIAIAVVVGLRYQVLISFPSLFLWSLLGLAVLLFNIYFFALIISIILSWIAPQTYHPGAQLLHQLTEPVMAPFRKMLPPAGGIDFSPILLFVVLNLINILVLHPLAQTLGVPKGLILGL